MAQVYLDEEEYETLVNYFVDNFEVDLTQAREYANDLLNELEFGKITEETPEVTEEIKEDKDNG